MAGMKRHVANKTGRFTSEARPTLKDIPVGETVLVRFKDEIETTLYEPFRLVERFFKDDFDRDREKYCGVFERVAQTEGGRL